MRALALGAMLLLAACETLEAPPDLGYQCAEGSTPAPAVNADRQRHIGMPCPIPTDRSVDCSGEPSPTPPPQVAVECAPPR